LNARRSGGPAPASARPATPSRRRWPAAAHCTWSSSA
jgi:hypothetical protein